MYILYGDYHYANSDIICAFKELPVVELLREQLELYGSDENRGCWEPPDMPDALLQKLIDTGEAVLKWKHVSYWLYLEEVEVV